VIQPCNTAWETCPDGGPFSVPSVGITSITRGVGGLNVNFLTIVLASAFPAYPAGVSLGPVNQGRLIQLIHNNGPSGGTGVTIPDTLANGNGIFQVTGCGGTLFGGTCNAATTTITVLETSGTLTNCSPCTAYNAYLQTPVVAFGNNGGNFTFHSKLQRLAIDCQMMPGVSAFVNFGSSEGSDIDLQTFNCVMPAVQIHLGFCTTYSSGFCTASTNAFSVGNIASGGINSGGMGYSFEINWSYEQCQLAGGCGSNGSGGAGWALNATTGFCYDNPSGGGSGSYLNPDPCAPNWVGFLLDGPGIGGGIHNTINYTISEADPPGNKIAEMPSTGACMLTYGVGVTLSGSHTEYCPNPIMIGGDTNQNSSFAGGPTANVKITPGGIISQTVAGGHSNFNINIGSTATNPLSGVVNTVRNIDVNAQVGNGTLGAGVGIIDNVTGRNVNCFTAGQTATNDFAFWYHLGTNGSVLTDSNCVNAAPQIAVPVIAVLGSTSGSASIGAAAVAGSPSRWLMPTSDGNVGDSLTFGTVSGGATQLSWSDPGIVNTLITTNQTLTCNNAGTLGNRGQSFGYNSGSALTVTVPDVSALGCANSFYYLYGRGAGVTTFNRSGANTFTVINNGSTIASTGLTSIQLWQGQHAVLYSEDNATSWVFRITGNQGTVFTCTQATPCATVATTITSNTSAAQYNTSAFLYCTSPAAAGTVQVTLTFTDPGGSVDTVTSANANCAVLGGSTSIARLSNFIIPQAGTAIQYNVTVAGGTPNYTLVVPVVRM